MADMCTSHTNMLDFCHCHHSTTGRERLSRSRRKNSEHRHMGMGTAAGYRNAGEGLSSGALAQKHSENSRLRSLKCKSYKPVATHLYPHTRQGHLRLQPSTFLSYGVRTPRPVGQPSHTIVYLTFRQIGKKKKKTSLCDPKTYTCDNLPMDHNESQHLSVNNHFLWVRTDGNLHVTALKLSMTLQTSTQFERNH